MDVAIIAGSDAEAWSCAQIKGLDKWRRVTKEEDLRGALKATHLYLFGTYRRTHILQWREWVGIAKARGAVVEEIVDGRLT